MIACRILPWLALSLILLAGSASGADLAISPFQTGNRAPMTQIFGLPTPGHALVLPPGEHAAELALDTAQNYTHNSSGGESAFFDGETYRFNLNLRRGLTPRLEVGLDLPYLMHRGGFLDGFIEGYRRACAESNIDYVMTDTSVPYDFMLSKYVAKRTLI